MKRFHTFLDTIKIPGFTTVSAVVVLGEQNSYLWWGDRVYIRPTQIGFDIAQEKFFALSALLGKKNTPIPAHLHKIHFYQEGKITHIQAASSFVNLWLQQVSKKKNTSGFQLITGRYVIPCGLSEAQAQIYEAVFAQVNGSWSALPSEVALREEISRSGLATNCGTILNLERDRAELLILSEKEILVQRTIVMGTEILMKNIDQKIREEYHLIVDDETLERLFDEISRLTSLPSETRMSIRGKNITTNLPSNVVIEFNSFTDPITRWLESLIQELKLLYSYLSPDILAEISPDIVVVGSGGNFQLVQIFLRENFQVTVPPFTQPELAIVKGAWHVA